MKDQLEDEIKKLKKDNHDLGYREERLLKHKIDLEDLIQEFGNNATDVFEQMMKGNWIDDMGHKVSMNDAMCRLCVTVKKVLDMRNETGTKD